MHAAKVTTLDELKIFVQLELLGKKAPLAVLRQAVGGLEPASRKVVGQALNTARETITAALDERRAGLEAEARRAVLEADRLDLTEVQPGPGIGHIHLVTKAIEELEDVFVGMGIHGRRGARGRERLEQLRRPQLPRGHPARDMYDTLYVNYGSRGPRCCAPTPRRCRCG